MVHEGARSGSGFVVTVHAGGLQVPKVRSVLRPDSTQVALHKTPAHPNPLHCKLSPAPAGMVVSRIKKRRTRRIVAHPQLATKSKVNCAPNQYKPPPSRHPEKVHSHWVRAEYRPELHCSIVRRVRRRQRESGTEYRTWPTHYFCPANLLYASATLPAFSSPSCRYTRYFSTNDSPFLNLWEPSFPWPPGKSCRPKGLGANRP